MRELLIILMSQISFVFNTPYCINNPHINWYYFSHKINWIEKQVIWLCDTEEYRKNKVRITIHELWHFYRYNYLSEEERQEFAAMRWTWWFVSNFAFRSVKEDFAESFSYAYTWWKDWIQKVKWIKQKILDFWK